RNLKIALILICTFTFFGCGSKTHDSRAEDALSDVIAKFPQLPKSKNNLADYYQLVRSVKNGYNNFEIQLRSEPDSIEDPQQILIFINKEGKYHALPFFSNTYRDYWNFPFDTLVPGVERAHSTFEKEFMTALNYLNLDDSMYWGNDVVDELMFSVLHCIRIEIENDSAELHIPPIRNNFKIPADDYEQTRLRLKKNYESILNAYTSENADSVFWDHLWDDKNGRIYEFIDKNRYGSKKTDLSIKVYRQEYISNFSSM
ncbi:MAG: hypothetical protein ACXWW0_06095, partial [Bacteroidia bacterium]